MNKHDYNSIEDLVFSKSFRDWILNKNVADARFWEEWILQNGEKTEILSHAKSIVYALSVDFYHLSDAEISIEVEKILGKLEAKPSILPSQSVSNNTAIIRIGNFVNRRKVWAGAATVIFICLLSYFYWFSTDKQILTTDSYYNWNVKGNSGIIELANHSDSIQMIHLYDSSKVLLSSNSKLTYSRNFSTDKREVYLTGEAFFIVTKNSAKPFLVYTKNMVTKVLGTSFKVKAYDSDNKASVNVESGKVSVYRRRDLVDGKIVWNKLNGFLIGQNQKIVYDFKKEQVSKTIVENPSIAINARQYPFVFKATPLTEVFKTMEKAYAIKLIYDEDAVQSYSLSATLNNESYFEKLNLICKAINASYEIIDGNIIITFKHMQMNR